MDICYLITARRKYWIWMADVAGNVAFKILARNSGVYVYMYTDIYIPYRY